MGLEIIIEELKNDKESLKNVAKVYEEIFLKDAFKIYKALDDKENIDRVKKEHFIKSAYDPEALLNEDGSKPTEDLYSERGDNFIKIADSYNDIKDYSCLKMKNYQDAIKCYDDANNNLKIKETITKIKITANNYVQDK